MMGPDLNPSIDVKAVFDRQKTMHTMGIVVFRKDFRVRYPFKRFSH